MTTCIHKIDVIKFSVKKEVRKSEEFNDEKAFLSRKKVGF